MPGVKSLVLNTIALLLYPAIVLVPFIIFIGDKRYIKKLPLTSQKIY